MNDYFTATSPHLQIDRQDGGRWAAHGTMNLFSSPAVCADCDVIY